VFTETTPFFGKESETDLKPMLKRVQSEPQTTLTCYFP